MSILIKGMEMPKEAGKYRIEFDQCGNPYLLSDNGDGGLWHIIPIPPHGRLIDGDIAEAICFTEEDENGKDFCDGILYAADWISEQPTIIPAEEGK